MSLHYPSPMPKAWGESFSAAIKINDVQKESLPVHHYICVVMLLNITSKNLASVASYLHVSMYYGCSKFLFF